MSRENEHEFFPAPGEEIKKDFPTDRKWYTVTIALTQRQRDFMATLYENFERDYEAFLPGLCLAHLNLLQARRLQPDGFQKTAPRLEQFEEKQCQSPAPATDTNAPLSDR